MFNLGPMELLVVAVIALVVLGPQRLPDAMRQVGKGVGELRRWSSQLTSEAQSAFVPGAEPAGSPLLRTGGGPAPSGQPVPVVPPGPSSGAAAADADTRTVDR